MCRRVLRRLLEQVNSRALFPERVTPLLMAIRGNRVAIAQLLLAHPGLDLEANTFMRDTPLQHAEAVGAHDIVALLKAGTGSGRGGGVGSGAAAGAQATGRCSHSPTCCTGRGSASASDCWALVRAAGHPECPPGALPIAFQACLQRACRDADPLGGFTLGPAFITNAARLDFPAAVWTPPRRRGAREAVAPALVVAAAGRVFCAALALLGEELPPREAQQPTIPQWREWWGAAFEFALHASFHASSHDVVVRLVSARLAGAQLHRSLCNAQRSGHSAAAGVSHAPSVPKLVRPAPGEGEAKRENPSDTPSTVAAVLPPCWEASLTATELAKAEAAASTA